MPQLFSEGANNLARISIVALTIIIITTLVAGFAVYRSPAVTAVKVAKQQPIPFSHQRHVAGNGIDCRYCHTTVEDSSFANVPPLETCMTCHSQVLSDQPIFDPLFEAWNQGEKVEWVRVNDVPDFVYFNHSIHVEKGVGCETCHGRVDQMPLTWKAETLHMQWCLECHKAPEKFLRPKDEVFTMGYTPTDAEGNRVDQLILGRELVEKHDVQVEQLTDCWVCHR